MKSLHLNPLVLILINIISPSMYMFLNGKYLEMYLLIFSTLLMALMGRYKHIVAMWGVFGTFMGIYYITLKTGTFIGLGLFLVVLSQSVPVLALAVLLITKYNSAQLLSALESLHCPRILVVAVTITLKYIPTFRREFSYIKESMRLRGFGFTWKKPFTSFKYFVVPQLFRCATLAEEVTAAGLVKGIDAPVRRTSYYEEKIRWFDLVILGVFFCGLAGVHVLKAKA